MNFKAPEILFGHGFYDFAIDMWGFGSLFASIIFRKNPFFGGRDYID